jgi:hypothetical protein
VSEAKEGQLVSGTFIEHGSKGEGEIDDAHANESKAQPLYGDMPNPASLDRDWIVQRLMREATDFGTRTRQSARVAALKTLIEVVNDLDAKKIGRSPFESLTKEQKFNRVKVLLEKLNIEGVKVERAPE